eukprot:TRINITY_DN14440_c0_g1_i2.p2 TRINITY_DN14440_c0_g1~~TRINITY_DN14440_c0_g1_i2.p2  ORF type:complete len:107 (+),score=36.76 TRINITY_DN14440_c0_g1_i2:128-448(+)
MFPFIRRVITLSAAALLTLAPQAAANFDFDPSQYEILDEVDASWEDVGLLQTGVHLMEGAPVELETGADASSAGGLHGRELVEEELSGAHAAGLAPEFDAASGKLL